MVGDYLKGVEIVSNKHVYADYAKWVLDCINEASANLDLDVHEFDNMDVVRVCSLGRAVPNTEVAAGIYMALRIGKGATVFSYYRNLYSYTRANKAQYVRSIVGKENYSMNDVNLFLNGLASYLSRVGGVMSETTPDFVMWDVNHLSGYMTPFVSAFSVDIAPAIIGGYAIGWGIVNGYVGFENNTIVYKGKKGRKK